jgi:hypothetical protein
VPKSNIFADPRYRDFVERYSADPLRFVYEVCGVAPSPDQEELLLSMIEPQAKVSVVSGTGTGKTAMFGRIALWHMLCHPVATYDGKVEIGSNTYIGAPLIQQVADGVWKEMSDTRIAIANGEFGWINQYYTIGKTKVYVHGYAEQWFITQVAMKKGEAIGVAGKHRYWQLIIIDEAAGVPDEHFNVIKGTQTQGGNRTLLASQGARNAGFFYETHHNLRLEGGGEWKALRFSSENSPFVDASWLRARLVECGGRNSIEYKIRVRGLFADDSANNLLTRDELEKCFPESGKAAVIADDEPYGLVVLSDVALGEYRDDSVIILAKIIGNGDIVGEPDARRVEYIEIPLCSNEKNEVDLAGDLVNYVGKLSNATLYMDGGGVGHTVAKLIEGSGGVVQKVNWGVPCFKKEYQTRFYNLRACAMVRFRDAVKQGRVRMPAGLDKRMREKILLQGSRLPYHFTEAGGLRYKMMSKEDMAKEGIKSPDLIDAFSFAFLEGCTTWRARWAGSTRARRRTRSTTSRTSSMRPWASAGRCRPDQAPASCGSSSLSTSEASMRRLRFAALPTGR